MQFDFADAVFEDDDHAHARVAAADGVDDGGVLGALHGGAVDGEDDVALAHARQRRRPVRLHVVHVSDHLYLLLLEDKYFIMSYIIIRRDF